MTTKDISKQVYHRCRCDECNKLIEEAMVCGDYHLLCLNCYIDKLNKLHKEEQYKEMNE